MSPKYAQRSRVESFNPDYQHIRKDLRRIALIAGTFIVVMVILSFFLR
ncbi:MAG: hypothetical protein ABSB61_05185 [Anaerolineales bacterium]|jgi:hypothetical protein